MLNINSKQVEDTHTASLHVYLCHPLCSLGLTAWDHKYTCFSHCSLWCLHSLLTDSTHLASAQRENFHEGRQLLPRIAFTFKTTQ